MAFSTLSIKDKANKISIWLREAIAITPETTEITNYGSQSLIHAFTLSGGAKLPYIRLKYVGSTKSTKAAAMCAHLIDLYVVDGKPFQGTYMEYLKSLNSKSFLPIQKIIFQAVDAQRKSPHICIAVNAINFQVINCLNGTCFSTSRLMNCVVLNDAQAIKRDGAIISKMYGQIDHLLLHGALKVELIRCKLNQLEPNSINLDQNAIISIKAMHYISTKYPKRTKQYFSIGTNDWKDVLAVTKQIRALQSDIAIIHCMFNNVEDAQRCIHTIHDLIFILSIFRTHMQYSINPQIYIPDAVKTVVFHVLKTLDWSVFEKVGPV
eukprot:4489_1